MAIDPDLIPVFTEIQERLARLKDTDAVHEERLDALEAAPVPPPPQFDGTLTPRDDFQAMINTADPGTRFRLAPGQYDRTRFIPKDGMSFVGDPDDRAVFDGGGDTLYFVNGAFADVTLGNLVVRNYLAGAQRGAINFNEALRGRLFNFEVSHTGFTGQWTPSAYGIRVAPGMIVEDGITHHNFSLGIGGPLGNGQVSRVASDWNNWKHSDDDVLEMLARAQAGGAAWTDSTLNHVNASPGWEAGATKFVNGDGAEIVEMTARYNGGYGLWQDIDNYDSWFRHCLSEYNLFMGISKELDYGGGIVDCLSKGNGWEPFIPNVNRGDIWAWGAQIVAQNSDDCLIARNEVETGEHYGDGIALIEQTRPHDTPSLHHHTTSRAIVLDNTIRQLNGLSGVFTERRSVEEMEVTWDRTTYDPIPTWWEAQGMVQRDRWRALGFDLNGSTMVL